MNQAQPVSNFDRDMPVYWEQAFNKFGFSDGEFSLTSAVADVLEGAGFEVDFELWGMHNEVITSIKQGGLELMPVHSETYTIGYSDPRDYLPSSVLRCLDGHFYGL